MTDFNLYHHLTRPAAVLRASGTNALEFLQNHFASDLDNPGVEKPVTYGLWLDQNGKIQGDSFVLQQSVEDFLLISYDCLPAHLLVHLRAHAQATSVNFRDISSDFGLLHLWSNLPSAPLHEIVEEIAPTAQVESWLGRRPVLFNAWDLLGTSSSLEMLVDYMRENGAEAVGAEELLALRIIAGIAAVPLDAGPDDFPSETGLDHEGISFEKDNYVGKEAVMRLRAEEKSNRALWQIAWDISATPTAGNEKLPLFLGQTKVGELRSRAKSRERALGLAMLEIDSLSNEQSLSFSPGGSKVVSLVNDLTNS